MASLKGNLKGVVITLCFCYCIASVAQDQEFALPGRSVRTVRIGNTWLVGGESAANYQFFSKIGDNANTYRGNANTNIAGIWQRFSKNTVFGGFYSHISSYTDSKFIFSDLNSGFSPDINTTFTTTRIKTNNFLLVLIQRFFNLVYIGAYGGYGWDNYFLRQVNNRFIVNTSFITNLGVTSFNGNTWTAGLVTYLAYAFRELNFKITLRYFHLDVSRPSYTLGSGLAEYTSPALDSNSDNFTEDLKVQLTPTKYFKPSFLAGALQVFKRRFSRPVAFGIDASPLPALILGNNAYTLGASLDSDFSKAVNFNFTYLYLKRGKEYQSNIYSVQLAFNLPT